MQYYIFVGMDLHDGTMVLKWAVDRSDPQSATYSNDPEGRCRMIGYFRGLLAQTRASRVFFAYEASCQGFGLHDQLCDAAFECAVLAPTRMPRSAQARKSKTDPRDAARIVDILRAHVLAGCELPAVWVPTLQTRDDREVVRARLDLSHKLVVLKNQVRTLLKRHQVRCPGSLGTGWTNAYRAWLRGLRREGTCLGPGARVALGTLLVQMETVQQQIAELDQEVERLSETERYAGPAAALQELKGVGPLTAMVFLTEMGDLSWFSNRRQVGSYLGLAPSSFESGEADDRKGHITRHGPSRVRRVLCQATWSRVRTAPRERIVYDRIRAKNPKHRKKAVVAIMRRLAVRMWHVGLGAQNRTALPAAG